MLTHSSSSPIDHENSLISSTIWIVFRATSKSPFIMRKIA
jgi:hypothetical protein